MRLKCVNRRRGGAGSTPAPRKEHGGKTARAGVCERVRGPPQLTSSPLPAPLFLPGYFPDSVATTFPLSPAAPASVSPQGLCAPVPQAALSSRSAPLAVFLP